MGLLHQALSPARPVPAAGRPVRLPGQRDGGHSHHGGLSHHRQLLRHGQEHEGRRRPDRQCHCAGHPSLLGVHHALAHAAEGLWADLIKNQKACLIKRQAFFLDKIKFLYIIIVNKKG